MENCLFCKIASGAIDSEMVYSDEHLFVIKDINPQAPTHLLIIPKKHIATLMDIEDSDKELMGLVLSVAKSLARKTIWNHRVSVWSSTADRVRGSRYFTFIFIYWVADP